MSQELHSMLKEVQFEPGDTLFQEGEVSYHFYILQSGEVEVLKKTADGNNLYLATVSEGSSVGEFAHIDKKPRSATVRAVTSVKAILVSQEAYIQLLEDLPQWATAMIEGLVSRLRESNEQLQAFRNLDEKTTTTLGAWEYQNEHTVMITDFKDVLNVRKS